MFSFFSSKEMTPIEKYFDSMGYFAKREIIRKAVHNYTQDVPFTNHEILLFAENEAKQSIFNASYNALQGASYETAIIGEPSIDPLTQTPNTPEEQKGVVGKVKDIYLSWRNESIFLLVGGLVVFFGIKRIFK